MKKTSLKGIGKLRDTGKAQSMRDPESASQLSEILDSASERAEFARFEEIALGSVQPDPEQPRQIELSLAELREPKTDDPRTLQLIESIQALAASMERVGQKTPIDVYQRDLSYVLIAGERRYWAARLLGWSSIHAKVLTERPRDLRLRQLVENVARQDLTPSEILNGLKALVAEAKDSGVNVQGASDLISAAGMSKTSAYRWWNILNAPAAVHELIHEGFGVAAVERVAMMKSADERRQAIEALRSDKGVEERAEEAGGSAAGKNAAPKKRAKPGRPRAYRVELSDPQIVAKLYRKLGGTGDVDWEDPKQAKQALVTLLESLSDDA